MPRKGCWHRLPVHLSPAKRAPGQPGSVWPSCLPPATDAAPSKWPQLREVLLLLVARAAPAPHFLVHLGPQSVPRQLSTVGEGRGSCGLLGAPVSAWRKCRSGGGRQQMAGPPCRGAAWLGMPHPFLQACDAPIWPSPGRAPDACEAGAAVRIRPPPTTHWHSPCKQEQEEPRVFFAPQVAAIELLFMA